MSLKDVLTKNPIINKMFEQAYARCIPLITTLEITQLCNFRCHHCYNFDRSLGIPEETIQKSLNHEEISLIIQELGEAGTLYLNFTGGEALLHPHIEQFIELARRLHMEPRLKSNGALLTKEKARRLNKAGLAGLDISLYGFSEESYQKLTGKEGMFSKSIAGIEAAVAEGFEVNVSIILHRYNISEINHMISYCKEKNIPHQFSTEITERYDGTKGSRDFEMTEAQFSELLEGEHHAIFMSLNPKKNVQCSCARSVCGISSTGEVYPCIGAPVPSGNLRDSAFSEIWNNSKVLNGIRGLKFEDFKSCSTCDHIEYCSRSSGSVYANTKNYTGCEPTILRQAEIRHEYKKKNEGSN